MNGKILSLDIRESVDSLCRDGADTQYMRYGIQFGACSALKNAITHGAHLHQTTATKDGAQIERHLVRTHKQKE